MPKIFDATFKDLVDSYPHDYEAVFDLAGAVPLVPENIDLSVVSAATDVVLGRGQPASSFIIIDFQADWAKDLLSRTLMYNAILHHRRQVPVHSIVVLLRPIANLDRLQQGVHYAVWPERGQTDHRFEIIKLWEQPLEKFLAAGLGTLPLAPLCHMPEGSTLEEVLPGILRRIDERLTKEAKPEDAGKLWTATFFLTGLRIAEETVLPMFQGVHGMKESSTYQYVLREGEAREARKLLLRRGTKKFGAPSGEISQTLEILGDLEKLERMIDRIDEVARWQELLDTQ